MNPSKVVYQTKDGKQEKAFEALPWLEAMCSHMPKKVEQIVNIMDTTAISRGANGKIKNRITSYLQSWSRVYHPKNPGKTGQGLFKEATTS